MKIFNHIYKPLPFDLKSWGLLLLLTIGAFMHAQAQLVIGGNVYGGGDKGNVGGSTSVQVISGDIEGSVFGGARMANVSGNASVDIDGVTEGSSNYTLIDRVYGGNDIAGTIGTASAIPANLNKATADEVDNTWNTFVHISDGGNDNQGNPNKKIYIGQLFGGGNGEYDYASQELANGDVRHIIYRKSHAVGDAPVAEVTTPANGAGFVVPDLQKTYVDIQGGSIVYAYGGGNNATVTESTVIRVENPSSVINSIVDERILNDEINNTISAQGELLTDARFKNQMGINTGFSKPNSDEFQIERLFGGNNMAEMAIRPLWHLQSGKVRNIYSGGNRGMMSSPEGLLLDIQEGSTIIVDNLYGGCRMADVRPLQFDHNGEHILDEQGHVQDMDVIQLTHPVYTFPAGFAARTVIHGGDVNNVYGGNDITGQVYGGNAVGLYTSIRGNLYGGGNGSYPYTDKPVMKDHDIYSDLYYDPDQILADAGITEIDPNLKSVTALNEFRPDAEQVSIHLIGKDKEHPTIIGGSVYCGGNSATIKSKSITGDRKVELKVGSYVIADNVFMGNNGENMIDTDILKFYSGSINPETGELVENGTEGSVDYSSMNLLDPGQFATYMDGAAMDLIPNVTFDNTQNGLDRFDYVDYSTYIGSFYWGGNVGSMTYAGTNKMDMYAKVVVYDKIVGGCNSAYVVATDYNAEYDGGLLGAKNEDNYTDNRLIMNIDGPKIEPKRWADDTKTELVWNTFKWDDDTDNGFIPIGIDNESEDMDRRLLGGNIYGGCYNSGHVNGNIVININNDLVKRDEVFAELAYEDEDDPESYYIDPSGERNSGVILDEQAFDVNTVALTVFGAGKGKHTEVWGSTTVNLNSGYAFQIFGGGEEGVVGKGNVKLDNNNQVAKDENGYPVKEYAFNLAYSTTVNMSGSTPYYPGDENMPEGLPQSEYLYGAGNEGDVCGNSNVYLGNGLIYDAFGGATNANIFGQSRVYIGRQIDSEGNITSGFPNVTDIVYGGNDFGGHIEGEHTDSYSFTSRVRDWDNDKTMIYGYDNTQPSKVPNVLKAASYVEYLQGSVDTIFGGAYGNYDYDDPEFYVDNHRVDMPYVHSTFVNFRPDNVNQNTVNAVFGGSTGYLGNRDGDKSLDHSYVLVDIPYNVENYRNTEFFGSGSYGGLGMRKTVLPMSKPADNATDEQKAEYSEYLEELDESSAIIDLIRGKVGAAYGGSYNEGITRRSVVNVPQGSTIDIGSIFGGAYGNVTLSPCDVYEANVNYHSADAVLTASPRRFDSQTGKYIGNDLLRGAIYGGNNNRRRTLYSKVTIDAPVRQNHWNYGNTTGTVYGAGCGNNTWSEYTEVNLLPGAEVYEVYGGGEDGLVINAQSIQKYINEFAAIQGLGQSSNFEDELEQWKDGWTLGGGYDSGLEAEFDNFTSFTGNNGTYYRTNTYTNLENPLVRRAVEYDNGTYNTNVIIHQGATVDGYAYGGGLGHKGKEQSGNIYGTTYIALLGGTVSKDLYAAGTTGAIMDAFGVGSQGEGGYTAGTTAYIEGGSVRNVYGGGWEGNVGYHVGTTENPNSTATDVPGRTNVVIGIRPEVAQTTYYKGDPAIQRNAYAGGEGGAVIGQANITINNGHIGYIHLADGQAIGENGKIISSPGATAQYVEKVDDETYYDSNDKNRWLGKNRLEDYGNVFGSGFDDLSSVDESNVFIYGGVIRNSVFGGGEIATVGRGASAGELGQVNIYKAGKTNIYMYNGLVKRNVFGGGKGYNKLGYGNSHSLYTQGYVFGQTDVNIYGGEIGTDEGIAQGYGNVFGGGDQGFVFSAYDYPNGRLGLGKKYGARYDDGEEGYYYKTLNGVPTDNNGNALTANAEKYMTEDCHVLIEPWLQIKPGAGSIAIGGKTYNEGDYVPTSYLNTLPKKGDAWGGNWTKLDVGDLQRGERGVIIHNAVFAGGNVSSGSDISANTKTVYGNATASINDVYHRDLITIGTGRIGGLYGDGNLTFVDGYRELNITNYGTDFYHIDPDINIDVYEGLPEREKAYYELKYKCVKECIDIEGTKYSVGSSIPQDQLVALFTGKDDILNADGTPNQTYWVKSGILLRAPGRTMNTLQRADFCGVFGSRLVMQGARDRVPEVVDYTNYTINRVREVSLNKRVSTAGDTDDKDKEHGNYFGIYSVVNYLGALTSDVDFGDETNTGAKRVTENQDAVTYKSDITIGGNTYHYTDDQYTYYNWKKAHITDRTRNNGSSHNQVALASGVYLELTNEKVLTEENTTGIDLYDKDWGIITGVVELDLINVSTGLGGGFVYAKNVHGTRSNTGKRQTTLSALNEGAATKKKYRYSGANSNDHWESSGNFVHSTQTIIDDCYNMSGRFYDDESNEIAAVPAHYWFIKGQIYLYDQVISAYTGAPNAYSEQVNIPLTISAGANGRMKLLEVQPNLYAYYQTYNENVKTPLTPTSKLVLNDITYGLNDPISYWEWQKLSKAEQKLFVPETYVVIEDCKIGDDIFYEGTVLLQSQYDALFVNNAKPANVTHKKMVDGVETDVAVDFDFVFRSSNNLSHNTGYILTYNVDNPLAWDKWYSPVSGSSSQDKVNSEVIKTKEQSDYNDGPTYTPVQSGLYGQYEYNPADIIAKEIYDKYNTAWGKYTATTDWTGLTDAQKEAKQATQATFERAYVTTAVVNANKLRGNGTGAIHLQKGAALAMSEYSESLENPSWPSELTGNVEPAFVCTSTIKLSDSEFITAGELMTEAKKNSYITAIDARINSLPEGDPGKSTLQTIKKEINNFIVEAYYCTSDTKKMYGGDYYESGHNYRALNAWSSMSESDREHFKFNYDALDLLIDPAYSGNSGHKYQYDSELATFEAAQANKAQYSLDNALDYTAQYNGAESLQYKTDADTDSTATQGTILSRTEFERLPNEQNNYAPIKVGKEGALYIVNTEFTHNEPFAVGQIISKDTYDNLTVNETLNEKQFVTTLTFATTDIGKTYYYCRRKYTIDNNVGKAVKAVWDNGSIEAGTIKEPGQEVPVGFIISQTGNDTEPAYQYQYGYLSLINQQKNFSIHGKAPVETSTLYVSRNSDIYDLSQEKIITVVYQYDYEESDETGYNITPVSERHVLNIHLQFKSGIPTIDDIMSPDLVLPGTSVALRTPEITPGAYEIIDRGWELFERESFAESHVNGVEYAPGADPLYWYQDGYYVAFYAKTYLGKTYSNYVPVSVANYHDLRSVMADKENHMFVDYDRTKLKRNSKIYINDYSSVNQNGLDLLKDLYDLSLISEQSAGVDQGVVKIAGNLYDHAILNTSTETGNDLSGKSVVKGVRGATNLDFILRTNLDHSGSSWTSIGTDDACFNGTLHGDGYTISGLTSSLFGHLCGDVYNLGVTGSFTGSGIAESGDGYVENSWISTTSTEAKTSKPIYGGNPTTDRIQIVNSYYMENDNVTNPYTVTSTNGTPIRKTEQQFYNGEVAYSLNGFYLNRRYYNGTNQSSGNAYHYLDSKNSNSLETIYYPDNANANFGYLGYVEDRYADGDYRFAAGNTETENDQHQVYEHEEDTKPIFAPVWPDDYIYFGQNLTFGYEDNKPHQSEPAHYYTTAVTSNRVYRAPAYYGNSTMSVAYFNPDAVLPATIKSDATKPAYKGLTAIDFTGYNDRSYEQGLNSDMFYAPLLDFDVLRSLRTDGQTQNLLAYTFAADEATTEVINDYFVEPEYAMYANILDDNGTPTNNANEYESIRKVDDNTVTKVRGHLVIKQENGTYQAAQDQFLVDKQDFNAPISYIMGTRTQNSNTYDNIIWYQRTPDVFVRNAGNGWESISLPFTAKRVTTSQKGWITHFYQGSKTGHEYWLRTPDKMDETDATGKKVLFKSIAKASADDIANGNGADITYNNRFLSKYYYNKNLGYDANSDTYHQEYYSSDVEYEKYPFAAATQPYLIGFPSERYYEFDMSGNFEPQNTAATAPDKLDRQTITFVSDWNNANVTINVTDDDYLTEATVEGANYKFKPTYQVQVLPGANTYLMNDDGTAFLNDIVNSTVETVPFRAYFTTPSSSHAQTRSAITRSAVANALYIGYAGDQDDLEDVASHGGLFIYGQDMSIYIESSLDYETHVTITTVAGKTLKQFTIQPGAKVQVPVNSRGVYIVNHKKIAVTK